MSKYMNTAFGGVSVKQTVYTRGDIAKLFAQPMYGAKKTRPSPNVTQAIRTAAALFTNSPGHKGEELMVISPDYPHQSFIPADRVWWIFLAFDASHIPFGITPALQRILDETGHPPTPLQLKEHPVTDTAQDLGYDPTSQQLVNDLNLDEGDEEPVAV
jgi:hypothetical protein